MYIVMEMVIQAPTRVLMMCDNAVRTRRLVMDRERMARVKKAMNIAGVAIFVVTYMAWSMFMERVPNLRR